MKAAEMKTIARLIARVLRNHSDETIIAETKRKAFEICEAFPLYRHLNQEEA
jgi:glycine/serine hydroxymethyltransferase